VADLAVGPGGWSARAPQRSDWRAPPFWQLGGPPAAVLNWPATAPWPTAPGWLRAPGTARGDAPLAAWGLDPANVAPAADLDTVRALRVHPDDITGPMLAELLQGLPEPARTEPLQAACRAAIAELATWQALSLDLLAQGCPQLVLRWDALAHLAAALLGPDGQLRLAQPWQLLGNLCRLMDLLLQALLAHLQADGHVVLVCAGTLPPALRPGAAGMLDRAEPGFAVMAGPGFAADALRQGGNLLDVVPSLRSALGLPALAGAPGRSWHRPVAGAPGAGAATAIITATADGGAVPPLLTPADLLAPAVGKPAGADWLQAQGQALPDLAPLQHIARDAHAQQLRGLALSLRDGGHEPAAAQALAAALAAAPHAAAPHWLALQWAAGRGDATAVRALLDAPSPLATLVPAGDLREAVLACAAQDWPLAEPVLRRLLSSRVWPLNLQTWLGRALAGQGRDAEAAEALTEALACPLDALDTARLLAQVQLRLGRHPQAEASARHAIALAPDSAAGHALLAEALAASGQQQAAIDAQWRACQLAPQHTGLRARWAELARYNVQASPSRNVAAVGASVVCTKRPLASP
jgi:tetratricopeptide (TPR) repeat protein